MPQAALLEIDDLHTRLAGAAVHRGITLRVEPDETVAVLGPNGAGKTTLMRVIAGLVRPERGTIRFAGHDITRRSPEDRVRLGITLVPEGRRMFSHLTVEENLLLGGYSRRHDGELLADIGRIKEHFPALRAAGRRLAGELSGGQQQMLALGRGLAARPRLLLLDEPSLGLSPVLVRELRTIIRELKESWETSILLVEQNVPTAVAVATRAYVLRSGKVVTEGNIHELVASQRLEAAYLGAADSSDGRLPTSRSDRRAEGGAAQDRGADTG